MVSSLKSAVNNAQKGLIVILRKLTNISSEGNGPELTACYQSE